MRPCHTLKRAYELAIEQYGLESRNTGLLAFNYGAALNDTGEFLNAVPVLSISVAALRSTIPFDDPDYYQASLEYRRALSGVEETGFAGELSRFEGQLTPMPIGPDVRVIPSCRTRRGRGGQVVTVRFSVDEVGIPQNIEVVESELGSLCDEAIVEGVSRFRYLPQIDENGVRVLTPVVQVEISVTAFD